MLGLRIPVRLQNDLGEPGVAYSVMAAGDRQHRENYEERECACGEGLAHSVG